MKAMRLTMKTTTKKAEARGAELEAIARMRRINGVKGAPSEGGSMEVVHIGNIAQFTCRERLRRMLLEKKGITWLKWRFIDENVQIHESQEGEGINVRNWHEINRNSLTFHFRHRRKPLLVWSWSMALSSRAKRFVRTQLSESS